MDGKKVMFEHTSCDESKIPEISMSVTTERPRNYLLKIESFSNLLLALSKTDRFEPLFDAGGHKWKLSLYPKGDKKRGGDGYISLYLALAEPYSLLQGQEVHAFVNFFVYNHHSDNYLVLQDGKEKRFHSLKTECGFVKLLSLETFNDPSKGYLVNDCCAFGVEVFFNERHYSTNLSSGERSFTWKIDKFSRLCESQVYCAEWFIRTFLYPEGYSKKGEKTKQDKYDSIRFDAGGHKWKLSLYPNGDNERGYGYISLYLALADPNPLPRGEELHAFINFFVYNHLRDSYLVLQDGKEKRFHSLNTECGFEKLLPLEIFNDPSEGYLVDDSCIFGVDVFVNKIERQGGLFYTKNIDSIVNSSSDFTWKIDKLSTLPHMLASQKFSVGGLEWSLEIHPNGDSLEHGRCLSLYLYIENHSSFPSGWNIYAEYKLRILDQLNQKHHERTAGGGDWFCKSATGYGYPEFLKLSDLKDASRGFIVNDAVVIQVKLTSISVLTSMN